MSVDCPMLRRFFARRSHQMAAELLRILEFPSLYGDQVPREPAAVRGALVEIQQLTAPSVEDLADPYDQIARFDAAREFWPTYPRLLVEGR